MDKLILHTMFDQFDEFFAHLVTGEGFGDRAYEKSAFNHYPSLNYN
jgi:hypothetical protein